MNDELREHVFKLPSEQRLSLAGELWDSCGDEEIPLTAAQKKLLRARLAEVRAHPEKLIPLSEFRKKLRAAVRASRRKQRRSA